MRVCRATQHAKATLLAGFTTLRDLGTEGAGYADVRFARYRSQAIRAREQGTNCHVPILALTAQVQANDRQACLEAGMDGYLTKPVQSQQLLQAMSSLLAVV